MNARRGGRLFVTAALAAALVLPGAAFAEEDGHTGGGGGGHGGGHTDDTTGSLYSDLVIAMREADGTPTITRFYVPGSEAAALAEDGDEVVEEATYYCVQPISYAAVPGVDPVTHELDGRAVYPIPLQGELIGTADAPTEIEPCDPRPEYGMYVSEAELERLNLTRTSEDVLESKLAEFATKWQLADEVTLDPAGRIAFDGTAIDASPDYAALYSTLMWTGGIKISDTLTVSEIDQEALEAPDFTFGPLELAAVAVGTAAGKYVPLTVDSIQYYNRIVGFTTPDTDGDLPDWNISFVRPDEPAATEAGDEDTSFRDALPGSEYFVDYGGFGKTEQGTGMDAFTYNRATTFPGSVTWLDVPTLTWKVSRILDVVDYTNLTNEPIGDRTLTGVTAFAQMADDVRATIVYLHENEVIPGFYMDPVGVDTAAAQLERLTNPATDLVLPNGPVFETQPFSLSASLFNPAGGNLIDNARLRVTITPEPGSTPLTAATVTASDGQVVPFDYDADAETLVGWWGPELGFVVPVTYDVSTTFEAVLPEETAGGYEVGLDLVDLDLLVSDPDNAVLASDREYLTVLDNVTTVLWTGDVPDVSTQGAQILLPLSVYSPTDTTAQLQLTVSMDDPTTEGEDALVPTSVRVYGEQGGAMVAMPFTDSDEDGVLTGTWAIDLTAGFNPVTWFFSVAEGSPVGTYTLDASLLDGTDEAEPVVIGISAAVDHKAPNAPVVEEKSVVGDSATIVVSSSSKDVTYFQFVLVKDFTHLSVDESYDGSWTYTDLNPGAYKAKVTAVDKAGNRSATVNVLFEIADSSSGGGGGGVITDPTKPADPGDGDPVVPPVDPEEPGDGAGEGGKPDTFIGKGPRSRTFVLGHSVTYRLRSNGDDVRYRVMLNNRFDQLCESNVCVVDGLKSGKNVLRFAAQANGQRDATPVVRKIYVPRNADDMRMTKRWTVRKNVRAFEGDLARTNQAGQVIRTRARDIRRIALVVAKGKGNGQVEVYLGKRLLTSTPIDLSNPINQHQVLVPVTTFRKLQTGFVRVKVVSQGKPVRIEGIGIVAR